MPKSIKILQMCVCLGGGGVETLLLNLQPKLPEHIAFDYLVAHPDFRDKEAQGMGSTVHVVPPEFSSPTRWATCVERLVQEHRYDVVHIHRFGFSGSVLKAAKKAGAKGRIAHSHRTNLHDKYLAMRLFYLPYHWTVNRWLLAKNATTVIGCSSDALRFSVGNFENNPKYKVLLNGIQTELFAQKIASSSKEKLGQQYDISGDTVVIGTLNRMTPVKNTLFVEQIYDTMVNRNKVGKSVLFIGGEGPMRPILEQYRDDNSLYSRILMPGHCTNAPELLGNLFDCFVTPSKMEGLPITIIEAVAAGLYVVCSDVITKDVTGAFPDRITTLPLSAPLERWAEAVEHAIQQRIPPEQGLELIRNSPMTFEHFAEEIVKIYENVSELQSEDCAG